MTKVKILVESQKPHDLFLEQIGFVTHSSIFRPETSSKYVYNTILNARILTVGAQMFKSKFSMSLSDYESLAHECMKDPNLNLKKPNKHLKYRAIDGRGNNLKHPEWGAAGTPFARFGPKNYDDGIYTIKRSVAGSDLPNPRLLVQELLLKAIRSPPPKVKYNLMALLIILFVTHDLHYQVPMQTQYNRRADIACCSKGNRDVLPPDLSNTACLPIEISKNDPFYKKGNVGCLNMVRSQLGKYTDGVEAGAILNHVTAFMDLSLIYGNNESELQQIRLYKCGKLRMGKNNILPVDANGKYLPSMDRFVATPIGSIWPSLFARNHNHLAHRLDKLNKHWNDETIFQEARRINIANFQFNLITAKSIEKVFNKVVNASYSEEYNAATFVEFSFTYRGGHYYIPSYMLFQNEDYSETKHLQSDTIGKISLLENNFDGALRGATNQPVNVGPYSDEVMNKTIASNLIFNFM